MTINQALVSGFAGADAQMRNNAATGNNMVFFTVATNHGHQNESGEWEKETEWHSIVAFGRLAEIASEGIRKGCRVTVLGRFRTRKWVGKDGIERYKTEIVASNIEFMAPTSNSQSSNEYNRPHQGLAQQGGPAPFEPEDIPF